MTIIFLVSFPPTYRHVTTSFSAISRPLANCCNSAPAEIKQYFEGWKESMVYSSSYIQLGLYCSPYEDPIRKHLEHNGIRNCFIFSKTKYPKYPCKSQCFLHPQQRFISMSDHSKLPNQNKKSRSVIVRSEVAGTGSPGTSYQLSEIQLGSKIRGICFYTVTSFIAIFLFVVMVVGHPFVLLRDRYQRNFHNFIAKIWASMTIAPFFRVKIQGSENLPPKDSPAIYVSNHQSFLDIYTLLTLGRNFKFVSKTAIFLYPVVGWAMFLLGTIPLKRMDRKSQLQTLKRCMELVKNGGSVFFFPEGTRSRDGSLGPFKKGAFSIAAKTGVPVVPITLVGTGKIMPAGMEGTVNAGAVKIFIHQPIIGDNPDILCTRVRNVIADELVRQA
ncbi:hypothetical protein L1987_34303 [Smallanthus sonchifolius]|uniref:Uncharacterized protein n=1 Tax=Smallanthus sonchifolius TaxID=185202 RepID=A0ACB9HUV2_9ASTR|nr:hypothetical protein L1987_34303 [Smallanthus sonchifolius]